LVEEKIVDAFASDTPFLPKLYEQRASACEKQSNKLNV
jgi:hypothetical protein